MRNNNTATIICCSVIVIVILIIVRKKWPKITKYVAIAILIVALFTVLGKPHYSDESRMRYSLVKGAIIAVAVFTLLECFVNFNE